MVDQRQIHILKQGVTAWNVWRRENEHIEIDLTGADLSRQDLRGIRLVDAHLNGVNFYRSDLRGALLRGANLSGANLQEADLLGAVLIRANLCGAKLAGAEMSKADLFGADMRGVDLNNTQMLHSVVEEANLSGHLNADKARDMPFVGIDEGSVQGLEKILSNDLMAHEIDELLARKQQATIKFDLNGSWSGSDMAEFYNGLIMLNNLLVLFDDSTVVATISTVSDNVGVVEQLLMNMTPVQIHNEIIPPAKQLRVCRNSLNQQGIVEILVDHGVSRLLLDFYTKSYSQEKRLDSEILNEITYEKIFKSRRYATCGKHVKERVFNIYLDLVSQRDKRMLGKKISNIVQKN